MDPKCPPKPSGVRGFVMDAGLYDVACYWFGHDIRFIQWVLNPQLTKVDIRVYYCMRCRCYVVQNDERVF
jgi:hypothetical protein